jgi:hypothetical protein
MIDLVCYIYLRYQLYSVSVVADFIGSLSSLHMKRFESKIMQVAVNTPPFSFFFVLCCPVLFMLLLLSMVMSSVIAFVIILLFEFGVLLRGSIVILHVNVICSCSLFFFVLVFILFLSCCFHLSLTIFNCCYLQSVENSRVGT